MSYILDALKKSEQERGHGNVPGVQTIHSSGLLYRNEKKSLWPYLLIIAVLLNLIVISVYIYTQKTGTQQKKERSTTVAQIKSENKAEQTPIFSRLNTLQTKRSQPHLPQPKIIRTSNKSTHKLTNKEEALTVNQLISIRQSDISPQQNRHTNRIKPDVRKKSRETKLVAKNLNHKSLPAGKAITPPPIKAGPKIIEQADLPAEIKRELPTMVITAHVYSSDPKQRSMVINNQFLGEGDYIMDGLVLFKITPDGAIFDYKGLLFHNHIVSSWKE